MKPILFRLALIAGAFYTFIACSAVNGTSRSKAEPVTHEAWTALLQKHVSSEGKVDYPGFIQDSLALNAYLSTLSSHHPNDTWTSNERKAYWINAYNAFTVQLVIRGYPVQSIKDLGGSIYKVNTPWDQRFILIEGKDYDLNNIEHDILREEWKDARIHFAVNCASVSCPKLINVAFDAATLDAQLDGAAKDFINNSDKNKLGTEKAELSRIFKWFKGDFTRNGSLVEFINTYATTPLTEDTDIDFLEYNWNLNE